MSPPVQALLACEVHGNRDLRSECCLRPPHATGLHADACAPPAPPSQQAPELASAVAATATACLTAAVAVMASVALAAGTAEKEAAATSDLTILAATAACKNPAVAVVAAADIAGMAVCLVDMTAHASLDAAAVAARTGLALALHVACLALTRAADATAAQVATKQPPETVNVFVMNSALA